PMRPQWRGIFLMGPDGRLLFDTAKPPGSAPADAPLEELARKALATGGAVVSDTLWPFAGESTSAVAVPIRMGGAEGYVIGARVDAEVWQRLLMRVQPPPGGFVALVDARQNVVASVGNLLRGRQIFATGAERAQARL
ncbi:cache domain-containing protein, partial [Streptomyces venezuelae]|uniref:cache domain-containing protein n=4 Tax=Bacteria TaxID=2 RepID=UPI001F1ADB9C